MRSSPGAFESSPTKLAWKVYVSLVPGQLDHIWMVLLQSGLGGHVGEVSSWEIRWVIPGPESTCKPLGLFGNVAQRIGLSFQVWKVVLKLRWGLTSRRWLAVKWTMLLHHISIPPGPHQPPSRALHSWSCSSPKEPWEIQPSIKELIYLTCPASYLERQFTALAVSASC